jgi:hypothetical protein
MSQDEDDTNPPDRGNPDLLRLYLLLFDLDPNEALDLCKNARMSGSNELKCICSRVMRLQQYRAYAVAMRVRGAGNQLQWGKVLPAALRAAWNYPEYKKQPPLPTPFKCRHRSLGAGAGSFDGERKTFHHRAGALACFSLLDLPAPFGMPRRLS